MILYYIAAIGSVILSGIAQVLLKAGSNLRQKNEGMSFINLYSIIAFVILFGSSLLSVFSLQKIMLKELVFILPLSNLFVPILSKLFLKEELTSRRILAIFVILLGIVVFNFQSK